MLPVEKQNNQTSQFTSRKLKKAALLVALDFSLTRMKKSPERCARNLLELGISAYPDKLSKSEMKDIPNKFLAACKSRDITKARELFITTFL